MRLVRAGLAEVNPLFNSLIFFPCVVTCESFDAWKIWATVKYLVLLLEYLKGLLGGLILVSGGLNLFKEGLLSDNIFVLFNNICMSCGQALTF